MKKRAYRDLREFVHELELNGELLRITAPVSNNLEITEITDIVCKSPAGGVALLFENVTGYDFPVLTNAFGSYRRICMALGVDDLEELANRLRTFLELEPPKSVKDGVRIFKTIGKALQFFPRRFRGNPPCQNIVRKGNFVNLGLLPVLKCWPKDGGPFITLPVVITKSLDTGKRNAGMYRLQVYNNRTTGMHWHIHKDGSHYFQEYRRKGIKMPVAVAIGTDPATTYAATAPLPRGIDEILFAGFIREKPVPMARCVTIDMEVPATAEFVLEGYVLPDEFRIEGPFGDHTGYYSLEDKYPVFHITAMTYRRGAIYPATIVGRPPMEDCYLAKATERLFLPLIKMVFPEIVDYWLPWEGVFHNITVVFIDKLYPAQAHKVMCGMWSQGQMAFCKIIVVADADLPMLKADDQEKAVIIVRHLLNTLDFDSDLFFSEGILDVLDHSAPHPLYGSKLGIDATRRLSSEKKRNQKTALLTPPPPEQVERVLHDIDGRITSIHVPDIDTLHKPILINLHKDGTISMQKLVPILLEHPDLKFYSIFVVLDDGIDLKDYSLVFWKLFNNVDPKRDVTVRKGRIVIDATKKGPEDGHNRPWPEDIVMDPDVKERVRKRAAELGIEKFLR
ncbi:MAG: menaquinone biosynthesis decarboxylase [Deltaproteobacteria bacterium]|nr:menaquinone biosynthesis decarboxylase [Deltaproteobacteria bacterium]MBW2067555.1 menaquinone biosynthesis decarboxylase [Deltaproteobacteria bacterium]